MDDLVTRRMSTADLDEVMEIEEASFTSPWSLASFMHELLQNPRALYLVATSGGRVVGYAGLWLIIDEGHITNIAVHPDYRRTGVAQRLIATLAEIGCSQGIKRFTLEVRVSNTPAQTLYNRIGFKPAGIRKGYYLDNHEDALIMWWDPAESDVFEPSV